MRLTPLALEGAYSCSLDAVQDGRGSFGRLFCADKFADTGLESNWVQTNLSRTSTRGTIRGMHFQTPPFVETKLLVCLAGCIFDVLLDLRKASATFGLWISIELDGSQGDAVYIPAGIAHGFQTLSDDVVLHYSHSRPYSPAHQSGVIFADPAVGIDWPLPVENLSERDSKLPFLHDLKEVL
ncbi:MAG: dTDP-4-dehydrorhamnose 3,5-epimerase family protein [Rhodobacteraceae bacterium]|nr:dTDP-4-dehydrorhamnose 3,5-epimerase family protein [Paracoccaceae bacterium]